MNDFYIKVTKLIDEFIRRANKTPNELWLGYREELELKNYIENYQGNYQNNSHVGFSTGSKLEFAGLKVRFEPIDWMFCVKFNPHY